LEVQDLLRIKTQNDLLTLDGPIPAASSKIILDLQKNFLSGVPFAYLLGFAEFYGRRFYVNPDVLIPRMETELLVDQLVRAKGSFKRVLDVATGSGVIGLSLALEGVAQELFLSDLSLDALEVAQVNARSYRLCPTFIHSDRLHAIEGVFDLIVANPPYIKRFAHEHLVHKQVKATEPSLALYLPDHEYEKWFDQFFSQVKEHLDGVFLMEGHELELQHQAQQLRKLGFSDIQVIKDLAGSDRFLMAKSKLHLLNSSSVSHF
jgi:release factor glutamine methyltransferase